MNAHLYSVLKTVIHYNREVNPFIQDCVSLDPEAVHLQMEDIKKDIQYATSYHLVNTPTPDKNILDTADDTINYIKAFLQPHHSYYLSSTTQYHLTPDPRKELRATTYATATASAPNAGISTSPLLKSIEEPSTFLSTLQLDNQMEEHTPIKNYTQTDCYKFEPSHVP